ncbi:PAS domain S-box protein [Thermodesulfobacteriota bacterium]
MTQCTHEDRRKMVNLSDEIAASLQDREGHLFAVLEGILAGAVVIDAETHTIVDVNAAACAMIGAPRERIIGHVCHSFICPAEIGKCPVTDLGQDVDHSERTLLDATGQRIPILKSVARFTSQDGELLIESFMDISDLRKSEESLIKSELRFRDIIEANADGIIIVDREGVVQFCNEAAKHLLGRRQGQLIGSSFGLPLSPGEAAELEVPLWDGNLRSVEMRVAETEWKDETAFLASLRDVTYHRNIEEQLRESETKYRGVFEDSRDAIYITTRTGRFVDFNHATVELYGYTREELMDLDVTELWEIQENRREFQRAIQQNGSVKDYEIQVRRKDGTVLVCLVTAAVRKDVSANVIGYEGIIRDITEQKLSRERLEQSFETLRRALRGTIQAMAMAVESRDPYTAGHQQRVARIAGAIAQVMGLPEEQVEGIRMAGVIHDLGKIGVPAGILSKPTRLTEIEFALIKIHAQVGYDILKDIEFPWPIAEIVIQHHEKMDGSGYPHGLSGHELLVESKILTVADVVEAIASHRPYRAALGIEVALEEISGKAGIHYDAEVVDACLRLFREEGFTLE